VALPSIDLLLPPRKEPQKPELMLDPLIGCHAQENSRRSAALGDHERLAKATDAAKDSRRILAEIGNRDDVGNTWHEWYLLSYVQAYHPVPQNATPDSPHLWLGPTCC
jgi:hypothetical protein